ncbi:hypothetical protein [Psychrobacter sp.]|uniref:hypothetical protein n=1 Tax=Psychrobacter sp. TaxID=56811 RepID=UPI003BAE5D30
MNFQELYSEGKNIENCTVDLTGWIVFIDEGLYFIEENYEPNYKNCKRVRISNRDIAYVLQKILPLVGGGETFLFHKAKISGKIISSPDLTIIPSEIYIEGWSSELEKVNISEENIKRCKSNSSELFDITEKSGYWFDI